MIEIKYQKIAPQGGMMKGFLRIIGKDLFFLTEKNEYAHDIVNKLSKRGAIIVSDKNNKWTKVDMFSSQENSYVRIGGKEFDVHETPDNEIEEILGDFYHLNFKKAGFACEVNYG